MNDTPTPAVEDLDRLESAARAATPGPWGWFGNIHDLYLATTNRGRQYVMGFRRMRTQSAQPVFRKGDRLVPAADLVRFEVGDGTAIGFAAGKADNTVYRYDVNGIDAPDAEFIAAFNPATALSLISALRASEAERERLRAESDKRYLRGLEAAARATTAEALAKEQAETIARLSAVIASLRNSADNVAYNTARTRPSGGDADGGVG